MPFLLQFQQTELIPSPLLKLASGAEVQPICTWIYSGSNQKQCELPIIFTGPTYEVTEAVARALLYRGDACSHKAWRAMNAETEALPPPALGSPALYARMY